MSIKYYTDTHIPKAVALQLRTRGIDVVRCEEVDLAEASDSEHLEYAAANGRTLISHDRDFWDIHARWLAEGREHCGIVLFGRQLQGNVGKLVTELADLAQMIEEDAASLEKDIYNQVYEIDR
jgi:predicted nuclease of predicted toxin-antitoxin system